MIYSVLQNKNVPVMVEKKTQYVAHGFNDFITTYSVYDASKPEMEYIGYVDLQDIKNGVNVLYIKKEAPNLYKHFADVADQIEVEHCLQRGIDKPYISSAAAKNTHVLHFLRGKRFHNEGINVYLDSITKDLKKGERISTELFGFEKMYMPINMLNNIKEKIKLNPLLKNLK